MYAGLRENGLADINSKMGCRPGKWTIPSQAVVALNGYGLNAKCFSSQDFPVDTMAGAKDFYKNAFGSDYKSLEKYIDIEVYVKFHKRAKSKGLYEVRKHDWDDLVNYFNNSSIVIPLIDYNILRGKDGPYIGHFVLIVNIDNESITIHDPDVGPNKQYNKEDFIKAFKAKEIDDDLLIISK